MKKIDLHIHTVATISDSAFNFSLDKLKNYVYEANLNAIAVTNHNIFDGEQFRTIRATLHIPVFPGIEINLNECHVLLIADGSKLDEFEAKAAQVTQAIADPRDCISFEQLESIYGNLEDYLIIPHYDKKPAIQGETLAKLKRYISAGEVDSAKKFLRVIKDSIGVTPVLFSDTRVSEELHNLPLRQTFIDCGELTLDAIKTCLRDKGKVALSEVDGNNVFQIFDDGQRISTGLNILLGERSSGKTHSLNRLHDINENVKYIRQFELVQPDEAGYEKQFNSDVQRRRSRFSDRYLQSFKSVIDDVINIDLSKNVREVEEYLSTLIKSAEEADRRDSFSKTMLFDETPFAVSNDQTLKDLIASVRQLIENIDYREVIERHLDLSSLKNLACELIDALWEKSLDKKKKQFVNGLIVDIKASLRMRTSAVQIDDVDLYRVSLEDKKVERFKEIVGFLRKEKVILEESIQNFKVVARQGTFKNATDLKSAFTLKTSFKDAMTAYGDPYNYLQLLLTNENLPQSDLYKLFAKISYQILNRDGYPVSGGERSEFRLLQEIKEAQKYDMLLIDEPESSFDNMFLRSDVNALIKDISRSMPVVVVTHNSTVGASVGPDYLLYTKKELEDGNVFYRIYSGYPTDKRLHSVDGKSIANHDIMMNSLEAGQDAYEERRHGYEAVKDR